MSRLQNIQLAIHAVTNLANLRRDILGNMDDAANAAENLWQYERRLDWHEDDDLIEDLAEGLSALGVTLSDYEAELVDLRETIAELAKPKALRDSEKETLIPHKRLFRPMDVPVRKRARGGG